MDNLPTGASYLQLLVASTTADDADAQDDPLRRPYCADESMLIALKIVVGVVTTLFCSALPWATARVANRVLAVVLAAFVAVAAAGVILGLALAPISDAVVLGVAVSGGVLLGRALPTRFTPVLIVLLALSLLDLGQVVVFSGPPSSGQSTQSAVPDPHLIWLNFRVPLPSGHFNVGFGDLLLVAALGENFRRRSAGWPIAALPGALALTAGTLIASAPVVQQFAAGAFSEALVPYLAAGWLIATAVAGLSRRQNPDHRREGEDASSLGTGQSSE